MNINELAKKIAINEGLKKQVSIAQIKEIIKYVAIVISDDEVTRDKFLAYGKKASKALGKKK